VPSQLEGTPRSDGGTLPWGASGWGRRELTIRQALELIRDPKPAPPVLATGELRYLSDWDWARLAADATGASRRPVLQGVRMAGGRALATDTHRLHTAAATCPDGLWDADTMAPLQGFGEYPPAVVAVRADQRGGIDGA
jgi:hypothetical protein